MVLIVEQMLEQRAKVTCTTRGKGATGNGVKGGGLKGWVEKYAPDVNYTTARRYADLARSVQDQFALPAKVRKNLGFAGLATADAAKLSDKERKLQQDLYAFIDGTSQRSWLDGFKQKKLPGGKNNGNSHPAPDPNAPATTAKDLLEATLRNLRDWHSQVGQAPLWTHLEEAQRRLLDEAMMTLHSGFAEAERLQRKSARTRSLKDGK